jgi:hypothetical protein
MNLRTPTLLAALAALALPGAAGAATPESGAVAKDTPVEWTGNITDPFGTYDLAEFFNGSTSVRGVDTCLQPYCDIFTLTVPDVGAESVVISASASDASNLVIDVTSPSGTLSTNAVEATTDPVAEVAAAPGKYTVRILGGGFVPGYDYTASAAVVFPDPDAVPAAEADTVTPPAAKRTAKQLKAKRSAAAKARARARR